MTVPPAALTASSHACFVKRCPAGIVEAVGFAHDYFAVAVPKQTNQLLHQLWAGYYAWQVFWVAQVGFNENPVFSHVIPNWQQLLLQCRLCRLLHGKS